MQHKEPTLIRKGSALYYADASSIPGHRVLFEDCKSISKAKARSLELQRQNGGRGMGYVRVER